jgi:6-pyruvoyltetrahydropterin/6-carboxytetrahydropterin synthase
MSTTIIRRIEADIGHRLMGHEGKCRNLHGHRYAFEIMVSASDLDQLGRVVDFSVIKNVVGGWVDTMLDHGFVGQEGDPLLAVCEAQDLKHYEVSYPPTAENLARLVAKAARDLLASWKDLVVVGVTCWETPNGRATYLFDP